MTTSNLEFSVITSVDGVEAIADAWSSLLLRSTCSRTFSSAAWNLTAFKLAVGSPMVIAGWRAGQLAAVFPLQVAPTGEAAALCSISDYNDIVCEAGDFAAAAECLRFALQPPKPYARLSLRRIAANSNCMRALRLLGGEGAGCYRREGAYSFVSLPGSFEEFLQSKSKNFRMNLRRAHRAAREDEVEIRELDRSQLCPEDLPELLTRLNSSRLGDRCVFTRDPHMIAFVRDAFPRLFSKGLLRVLAIQAGGRIEAVDVIALGAGSLCTWNGGYSPRAARWSPGWLLSAAAIRCAIEAGYREYDLLRGTQPWKARLANRVRDVGRLEIPVGAFSARGKGPGLPRARRIVNVCVKGSHDWLFGDLRARFAQTQIPGVRVLATEDPCRDADAWIFIRTAEASASPDLSRTVVCLHDLYCHDSMYSVDGARAAVRRAGALVLCHPRQREILAEAGVVLEDKLILERPLGALQAFTERPERPERFTIGWVGRDHWRKRPELLVEAIHYFRRVCPEFQVMLIGKELDSLHAQFCAAGIACALHDRRTTPIDSYPALYKKMECLLITSCTEAGPLPLFEALATGVPVVSTPVGWAPHLAAVEPAFVRLGDNPRQLAEGLEYVWRHSGELFAARSRIAALADSPRLDTWFGDTLRLAAALCEYRETAGIDL